MAATTEPNMIYPGGGTGSTSASAGTGFNANMFDSSGPTEYAQALGQVGQKLGDLNQKAQQLAQSLQAAGSAGGALGQATGASGVSMGSSSAVHGQNQGGAFNTGGWSQNWGGGSTTSTGSSVPNGGAQSGGGAAPPPGGPPGGPGGAGGGPPPNGGVQSGAARGAQAGFDVGAAAGGGLARFGQTNMPAAVAAQWQGAQLGMAAGGGGNATMRDRQMMGIFNPSQSGIWGGSLSTTDRAAAAGQIYQMTGQTPLSQGAGQQSYQNVAGGVSGFSMLMPGAGNAQTSQMLQQGLYSPQAFQRNRAIGINTINPGGGRVNPNQVIQQVMSRTLGGQQINQASAQAMVPGNPLYANLARSFGEEGQGNDPLTQAAATAIQAQQAWQQKNPGKPAPNPFAAGKPGQQAQQALGLANNTQWQQQSAQFTKQNAQSNTFQGANTAESTFANAVNKFYAAVDKLTGGAVGSGIGLGSGLLGHLGVGGGGLLGGGGGGLLGGVGGGLLGGLLGGGGILGKLGGLFKGGAEGAGGILGKIGGWLGGAGGKVKDWFVNKGKDIWKNTKENPFGGGPGEGGEYGKFPGEPGGPPLDVPAFGSPGPVQTSQTSGDKATGPVMAGSSTSPTPQGTQAVTTAMYQPGGGSTASALKSMSDALGGIPHSVLNPDTDTEDVYHKSHQAIDLVDAIGGSDKKAVQEAAKNSHTKKDSAGLLQINKKMAQLYGPGLAELIYAGPGGVNIKNGKVVDPGVYGKKVMDTHHDHVHVAATIASLKAAGFDMLGRKIKQPAQGGQLQQGSGGAAPPAGPAGPVGTINTEADFARALLTNLGVSTAPALVNAIVKWEQMEEGNWTGTPHPNLYNPLNTGKQEPGATGSSAGGMLAYPDWPTGVKATADTIRQPNMKPIYDALKSGNIAQLQAALQSSPWSGSKYPGLNLGGGTAPASGGSAPAPNVSQQNQQGQSGGGGAGGKNAAATGTSEGGVTSEGNILSASFAKLSEGGGGAQQAKPQQQGAQGGAPPAPGNLMHASPAAAKAYAQTVAQKRGWNFADWDYVANAESGWRWNAANPSGAYGIPQALPGSKMASAGADWKDNAGTQINWMADYMDTRWHGAAGAAAQERSSHWYHTGLWDVPKDQLAWLQRGEMVVAQSAAQLARDKTANGSTPASKGGGISVTLAAGAVQGVQGINSNLDAQRLGKSIANAIKEDDQLKALVGQ